MLDRSKSKETALLAYDTTHSSWNGVAALQDKQAETKTPILHLVQCKPSFTEHIRSLGIN